MNFNQYIETVRKRCKELPLHEHLVHMGMGVVGEMGEIVDAMKKTVIYGKTLDMVNVKEEVGDTCWYIGGFAMKHGITGLVLDAHVHVGIAMYTSEGAYADVGDDEFALTMSILASAAVLEMLTAQDNVQEAMQPLKSLAEMVGLMCARWSLDIGDVLDMNDAKLEKRYGARYSGEAAINRDTAAERALMENYTAGTDRNGT